MSDRISRRAFALLTAGVGVPLAGCGTEDPEEDDAGSGTPTGTPTESTPGDGTDTEADGEEEPLIDVDEDAEVFFEAPTDGEVAANGVTLSMVAENFDIEESGSVRDNAGHFHVIVDEGPVETGEVIPLDDDAYRHYGDGSTRDVLALSAGTHELTLQPGDGQHRAVPLTDTVEVTVEDASVSFGAPADGDTVESPVALEFETSGNLAVEEAGPLSQAAGHFHVIVDEGPVETGEVIPLEEEAYVHFGDGSTEAEVDLPEGEHELTLQMGDGEHLALPETDSVSVEVVAGETADHTVTVAPGGSLAFEPDALEIAAGETVEWVWEGSGHNINVLSQPDEADWGGVDDLQSEGFRHTHTFDVPGEYEYQCNPHQSVMQGTLTVE